ncbi:glycoside hydrolase [Aeromonas sp. HMWF036]|uniref:glycosyltransferase n=1 Tax=Aeromonas TaxID=642 RepID=UPI000D37CD61|nr:MULTISPECIES: glycosyltransferase [Aeromonas]MCF5873566.1 glycosyltransferase [Aeromonas veronii]MCS0540018.1 glycosyltransferase [Aeromonas veronii]PTS80586.1 glycoside hydrolase [Aeromonas sp. HMWF036]PTT23650.1 glycoside hydrolase [Aeromonas sp. HMWF017]
MSVRKFGIYLCYAPSVDLRKEGLGRYLAAFLKGAAVRDDVKFTLVCPSWSTKDLYDLFDSENVPHDSFSIRSPEKRPLLLDLYHWYINRKTKIRKRKTLKSFLLGLVGSLKENIFHYVEKRLLNAYTTLDLILLGVEGCLLFLLALIIFPLFFIFSFPFLLAFFCVRRLKLIVLGRFSKYIGRFMKMIYSPKDDGFVLRLYRNMELVEGKRISALIDSMHDISAWYCPTAYWPEFNKIDAPRLMCVPDVVLREFPVAFSQIGGDRTLSTFKLLEEAIRTGDHFVTYSEVVKWNTLIDGYQVSVDKVSVVHHAANKVDSFINITGLPDNEEATTNYAKSLLISAIRKSNEQNYVSMFKNKDVEFVFYASQIRPNKNIISLFKAYEYLLRKKFVQHKLIVTGSISVIPEVKEFIISHNLQHDILFLHGLTMQELAACYKLASLAVNPSLSEGGCPFTFTEALSVNTPVVMARIPVTEEILTDPELQEMTFFDPYDWRDMAKRIEWALHHKDILLRKQLQIYDQLSMRTWSDVVNEHIDILERISCLEK